VTLPAAGAAYSPRNLLTSTMAANACASRLIVNPLLSVDLPSGVRYLTRSRFAPLAWTVESGSHWHFRVGWW
jgi:hypothetical protein